MKKLTILLLLAMTITLSACEIKDRAETTESREETQMEQKTEESGKTAQETESKDAEPEEGTGENTEEVTGKVTTETASYDALLTLYSTAVSERWSGATLMENNLNYMMADCYGDQPFERIGYLIKDLDGDGIQELAIGTTEKISDDFYGKLVFELYTLDGNSNVVKVFSSSERDRYYYAGDNLFANLGSSGAAESIDTTVKFANGATLDLGSATEPSAYRQMELAEFSHQQDVAGEQPDSSLQLPILDEINQNTAVGTAGAYLTAVQSVVKLLDWGTATGLDAEEIKAATVAWMADKGNDGQAAFAEKLTEVDEAYKQLLEDGAEELLISAGCEDAAYPWSDAPVESIEAIMEAVGLR